MPTLSIEICGAFVKKKEENIIYYKQFKKKKKKSCKEIYKSFRKKL